MPPLTHDDALVITRALQMTSARFYSQARAHLQMDHLISAIISQGDAAWTSHRARRHLFALINTNPED